MLKAIFFTDESLKNYRQDLQKSLESSEITDDFFTKSVEEIDDLAEGTFNGQTLYVKISKSEDDSDDLNTEDDSEENNE